MYPGLFAAALVALILTIVSAFFLGKRGPWGSIWTFFLVLFLALSTVSIYVAPIGPRYWGIAWMPITIAGVIMTVLLIAAMPHDHKRQVGQYTSDAPEIDTTTGLATIRGSHFFWVLIVLLVIAIIVGMSNPQKAM